MDDLQPQFGYISTYMSGAKRLVIHCLRRKTEGAGSRVWCGPIYDDEDDNDDEEDGDEEQTLLGCRLLFYEAACLLCLWCDVDVRKSVVRVNVPGFVSDNGCVIYVLKSVCQIKSSFPNFFGHSSATRSSFLFFHAASAAFCSFQVHILL